MQFRKFCFFLFGCFIFSTFYGLLIAPVYGQHANKINDLFKTMKWRNIGPANMGGRTVDIEVVESSPWIIYAAIGPSGVWKSINNGTTWFPVFENEPTVSVGDIAVCQARPEIIWVGTGEATARNSVTIGDGVYKSEDGGKTWTNMGLAETRHISRILIDKDSPETVYIAAQGHLWGENQERGVYKTTDGGKSWENILYIDASTGIADLAIDPSDNKILYAAAWQYQRYPYYFYSGGPESGIYKTTDGGEKWRKLSSDLPDGIMGRIGLAVSKSRPEVVYALIEHLDGGIWRSEDRGESWTRTCDNKTFEMVNFRPFYYSQIRVDPGDDKKIYVFSGGAYVSEDMGNKFRAISNGTHSDHHTLWIDPANPDHLIDGNDGGIDVTYDGGKNWRAVRHMALAEVYQVGYDMRKPYHVYCGLQDNGVWGGPSATYDTAGITNDDWYVIPVMGDGFYVTVDPTDHRIVYANFQMNGLTRADMRIGRGQSIRPEASLNEPPYRWNWNSPIYISPHDPNTVYTGGNFLFRTRDGGRSWQVISPDLSTNNPDKLKDSGGPITPDNTGAEIHCTIVTISESPVNPGIIWCGTDDGNIQITRDSGKSWENVIDRIPGLPPHTWCSRVEASHFEAGTAYAAFDGHRSDDYFPYLYKTTDFGQSWISIKGNLPFGWLHVIREDLKNPRLLFAGMEFGIFASLDGGESWFSMRNNLPTAAVRDIAVHPRDNDLIIGTHGRGIWILDDITPLRGMSDELLSSAAHIFDIRSAEQIFTSTRYEGFARHDFSAKNPAYGMTVWAYCGEDPSERPQLRFIDEDKNTVFEVKIKKQQGLQSFTWNLQTAPKSADGKPISSAGVGMIIPPLVVPGEYLVELEIGDNTISKTGIINPDPRFEFSDSERELQYKTQSEIAVLSRKMSLAATGIVSLQRQLDKLRKELGEDKKLPDAVKDELEAFEYVFSSLAEDIKPKGIGYRGSMQAALRGGPIGGGISGYLLFLGMTVGSFPSAPTETQLFHLGEVKPEVASLIERYNSFLSGQGILKLNEVLKAHQFKPLRIPKKVEI